MSIPESTNRSVAKAWEVEGKGKGGNLEGIAWFVCIFAAGIDGCIWANGIASGWTQNG